VKGLNCDFQFVTGSVLPIKYVISQFEDQEDKMQEIFFVIQDHEGYRINIISFKDKNSPNPLKTLREEGSKIVSLYLKNNLLFYIDETMRVRVLEVK